MPPIMGAKMDGICKVTYATLNRDFGYYFAGIEIPGYVNGKASIRKVFGPLFGIALPNRIRRRTKYPRRSSYRIARIHDRGLLMGVFFHRTVITFGIITYDSHVPGPAHDQILYRVLTGF